MRSLNGHQKVKMLKNAIIHTIYISSGGIFYEEVRKLYFGVIKVQTWGYERSNQLHRHIFFSRKCIFHQNNSLTAFLLRIQTLTQGASYH